MNNLLTDLFLFRSGYIFWPCVAFHMVVTLGALVTMFFEMEYVLEVAKEAHSDTRPAWAWCYKWIVYLILIFLILALTYRMSAIITIVTTVSCEYLYIRHFWILMSSNEAEKGIHRRQ